MAGTRRRPWRSLTDPVVVGYQVERETKKAFDSIADNADMSGAAFLEAVMRHTVEAELTDQGIPSVGGAGSYAPGPGLSLATEQNRGDSR
jgi:hypothetical protein